MNQVIKAEPQVLLSLFSEGSSLQIVAMAVAYFDSHDFVDLGLASSPRPRLSSGMGLGTRLVRVRVWSSVCP